MNIKTTIFVISASIGILANAGLYFVSGGDFRIPPIEYTIKTDQNNQTVNISPSAVREFKFKDVDSNSTGLLVGNWSVKLVDISNKVEYIGTNGTPLSYTFPASGLHKVKLYNNSYIDIISLFQGTYNIVDVTIRGNTGAIFQYMPSLKSATLVDVDRIVESQFSLTSIANITFIGKKPKSIGYQAFAFSKFKQFEIPDTVEEIGWSAFTHSEMTSIILPNRDIKISTTMHKSSASNFTSVFRMSSIKDVFFKGNLSDWNSNATYVYIFGSPKGQPVNGTVVLDVSDYAKALNEERTNWQGKYDSQPPSDTFYNNLSNGNVKLHFQE